MLGYQKLLISELQMRACGYIAEILVARMKAALSLKTKANHSVTITVLTLHPITMICNV
jgi:hypothetical protein